MPEARGARTGGNRPFPKVTHAVDLDSLRDAGLYRRRRVVERALPGARCVVDGREVLNFCSNDYLGLAQDPRVAGALSRAALGHGAGSGASHLVTGQHREHHALEEELAAFTGRPRALLFSSGYMANLGLVAALASRESAAYGDRLNHASLIHGGRLSRAALHHYPHGDVAALETQLASQESGRAIVLIDGVFSMDGDLAPLPALAAVCTRHNAFLAVDDAHGLGVIGACNTL